MSNFNEFLKEQWDKVEQLEFREVEQLEFREKESRKRNNFKRDYARVIYSTSFRRQQGKMQLFEINSQTFHRNRLTHSFEVAQIANGIVDELRHRVENTDNRIDEELFKKFSNMATVVETASLIHDIGNPPFGHHGERVLNELAPKIGFEGNAQGIRILRKIEKKSPKERGLNLTYRTLAAIIKYYVPYTKGTKKFLYKDDYEELKEILEDKKILLPFRTIDVQVVDLADEIAYCAHDLEDALSNNYFTIDEFIFRLEQNKEFNDECKKDFKEWVEKAKKFAKDSNTTDDYDFYFRRELISIIVNKLIKDITVVDLDKKFKEKTGTCNEQELGFKNYRDLATALKKTVFNCVTNSDNIMLYERVGTKDLTKLFNLFVNESYNKNGLLMPIEYRWDDKTEQSEKIRKVLDYISGMMDTYAVEVYIKHFGKDPFIVKYDQDIFKVDNKR